MKYSRINHTFAIALGFVLVCAVTSTFACSLPVIDGRPVSVAPLDYLVRTSESIAQIELQEKQGAQWKVHVIDWLKNIGPNSIVIGGIRGICLGDPLRPADRLVVFLSPAIAVGRYELIATGGDVNFWIASNYLNAASEIAAEIKRLDRTQK